MAYAFCPNCLGIFQSRSFPSGSGNMVIDCAETCIFCGSVARVESDLPKLKGIIAEVLRYKSMATKEASDVKAILQDLAAKRITLDEAAKKIDSVSPGLGRKIFDTIKAHGEITIPLLIAATAVFVNYQMLHASREANEISRQALEFAIEQAAEQAVSKEHKPSKQDVTEAGPHHPVAENRKARRAKKAQERRAKRTGRPY